MESKTVIITGATGGLGLACCENLLGQNYHVIAICRKTSPELNDLAQLHQTRLSIFNFDLENVSEIPNLVKTIRKDNKKIFGLVNNAAIGYDGVLATQHASDINKILTVNLLAPITLAKYLVRSMLSYGEGRIINISSIIASTGFSGLSVYGASKAGLEGFTRSLSREVGRYGITVNCVAPGFMETKMTDSLEGEKLNSIRRRTPLGLATVDDAAGAVSYLLSEQANRITGTTITVDGGSTA